MPIPQTESVEDVQSENEPLDLMCRHDESSESDDFIVAESRRRKRESKKGVKISPFSKGMRQDQKNPGLPKPRGRKPSKAATSKTIKNNNKKNDDDNSRPNLELYRSTKERSCYLSERFNISIFLPLYWSSGDYG